MRRFQLVRHEDVTGLSGTGVVADGVQFDDGKVVTRWRADIAQTCVWDSIEHVKAIHGHAGATTVRWIDTDIDALRLRFLGPTDDVVESAVEEIERLRGEIRRRDEEGRERTAAGLRERNRADRAEAKVEAVRSLAGEWLAEAAAGMTPASREPVRALAHRLLHTIREEA